jgi:ribosomal-protein-alanine N-acetyltransferase
VNVRPTTEQDIAPVLALESAAFGTDAWSHASLVEELTSAGRRAVVAAEADGSVIGYAVTMRSGDVVDLHRIAVAPERRRTGVARKLLAEVQRTARADGGERMMLEVSVENESALAFYATAGFAEIDRRPRYYRDGADAVVLCLDLSDTESLERA